MAGKVTFAAGQFLTGSNISQSGNWAGFTTLAASSLDAVTWGTGATVTGLSAATPRTIPAGVTVEALIRFVSGAGSFLMYV